MQETPLTSTATTADEKQHGDEIGEEDGPRGNRKRDQIHVVAAVGEDGIPAPHGNGSRHGHRKHDEEVFIGKGDQQWVYVGGAAQPLQERSIFVQQEERDESSGHGEQGEDEANAEIEAFGVRVAAAAEDAGDEQIDHSPERTLPVLVPLAKGVVDLPRDHAAFVFMTETMSRATPIVSTSSTRCRNVFSSD